MLGLRAFPGRKGFDLKGKAHKADVIIGKVSFGEVIVSGDNLLGGLEWVRVWEWGPLPGFLGLMLKLPASFLSLRTGTLRSEFSFFVGYFWMLPALCRTGKTVSARGSQASSVLGCHTDGSVLGWASCFWVMSAAAGRPSDRCRNLLFPRMTRDGLEVEFLDPPWRGMVPFSGKL